MNKEPTDLELAKGDVASLADWVDSMTHTADHFAWLEGAYTFMCTTKGLQNGGVDPWSYKPFVDACQKIRDQYEVWSREIPPPGRPRKRGRA